MIFLVILVSSLGALLYLTILAQRVYEAFRCPERGASLSHSVQNISAVLLSPGAGCVFIALLLEYLYETQVA